MSDPGFQSADDDADAPRRRPRWVIATGIVLAVALAAFFVVPALGNWFVVSVGDNRPSGVACADLPTLAEVESALALHADLVRQIEAVGADDGSVTVEITQVCPEPHSDHAEIVVFYPGGTQRERIEAMLAEESFGVPVSLRNV